MEGGARRPQPPTRTPSVAEPHDAMHLPLARPAAGAATAWQQQWEPQPAAVVSLAMEVLKALVGPAWPRRSASPSPAVHSAAGLPAWLTIVPAAQRATQMPGNGMPPTVLTWLLVRWRCVQPCKRTACARQAGLRLCTASLLSWGRHASGVFAGWIRGEQGGK